MGCGPARTGSGGDGGAEGRSGTTGRAAIVGYLGAMGRHKRRKKLRPPHSLVNDARRRANRRSGLSRQHGALIPAAERTTAAALSPPAANEQPDQSSPAADDKPDPTGPAGEPHAGPAITARLINGLPVHGPDRDAPPLQDWPYPPPTLGADPAHLLPTGWFDADPHLPDALDEYDDPGLEACTQQRRQILDWVTDGLARAAEGDDPPGVARVVPVLAADGSGVTTAQTTAADTALAVILAAAATADLAGFELFHLRPENPDDTPGIGCICIHDSCADAYEDAYDRAEITGPYLTSFEASAAAPSVTAVEVPWLSGRAVLDMCLRRGLGW